MAYISSNDNRFYVALEGSYGQVAAAASFSRIPAVKLAATQQLERAERKDKTGSRTFVGYPTGGRRANTFDLTTYMRDWSDQTQPPGYGPLFQACLGQAPAIAAPLTIGSASSPVQFAFTTAHGLTPGQAVAYGSEVRFVSAVADTQTIVLNAPFTSSPGSGATFGASTTYLLANELSSATIFDCWSPTTAVQRIISGAAVDQLQIQVNGDYQAFRFTGPAADIIDSVSFQQGQGGLTSFPSEPLSTGYDYTIVPGHLGQVWIGSAPNEFFTLTAATVTLKNNLLLRDREFGSNLARGISPGTRTVTLDFSLYQEDDAQTQALYQAARQESPVGVMLQLGQQAGQMAAIYLKGVMLVTPQFDDSDTRLQWTFKSSRAQGVADDEISIAFA